MEELYYMIYILVFIIGTTPLPLIVLEIIAIGIPFTVYASFSASTTSFMLFPLISIV